MTREPELFPTEERLPDPQANPEVWHELSRVRASFQMRSDTLMRHEGELDKAKARGDFVAEREWERKVHRARMRVREVRSRIDELEEKLYGDWAPEESATPEAQHRVRRGWGRE